MLNSGGHQMTFARLCRQGAVEHGVVALRAATGEDDLARLGIQQRGDFSPRIVERAGKLVTEPIGA